MRRFIVYIVYTNKLIGILVYNCMPNISYLAKVLLQIFSLQVCSYTKCECPEKGNNSSKIYEICSKVNHSIYFLVCNCMLNISYLAKVLLQIFCLQVCSYTKCECPEKGNNSSKIYEICSKVNHSIYFLVYNCMPNISYLAKVLLQIFCLQVCSYTKCECPEKGNNSSKIYEICSKVNHSIYFLVCNCMLNISYLAKVLLQIFCLQVCSYTKCQCPEKGNNSSKIYEICSKVNHSIYFLVCNCMLNISYLGKVLLQIFCLQGCCYIKSSTRKRGIRPEVQDRRSDKKSTGPLIFSGTCKLYSVSGF